MKTFAGFMAGVSLSALLFGARAANLCEHARKQEHWRMVAEAIRTGNARACPTYHNARGWEWIERKSSAYNPDSVSLIPGLE